MRLIGLRHLAQLMAFVLAAAVLAGCAQSRSAQVERPQLLQSASTGFLAGRYEEAVISYTDFLATSPGPDLAAEAYVGRGNAYHKLAKYELAEADYRAAVTQTKNRSLKAQGVMGMGNCAMALERFDTAERLYRDVRKFYKGLVPQDEATFRLGLSLARQAKWDEAKDLLEEVVASWPSGDNAKAAKAKLPSVQDRFFTVQVGAFTNKTMAETTLNDLKAKGFVGTLEPIDIYGVPGFAVRAGRFSMWQAVTDHAEKLKNAGFSTYKLP